MTRGTSPFKLLLPIRATKEIAAVATYLLRRLGASVVVVIGISIFTFGMLHLIFPSPAIVVLGSRANSRADRGVQ